MNNEPGINGDAMAANTRTRIKNLYAGMPIGQINYIPNVNFKSIRYHRQLIRESYVYIPEGILGQFDHFCCSGSGGDTSPPDKRFIKALCASSASVCNAADASIVAYKFDEDSPW